MRNFQLIKWVFVRLPHGTLPRINVAFAHGAFIAGSYLLLPHRKMEGWRGPIAGLRCAFRAQRSFGQRAGKQRGRRGSPGASNSK
jgi:hypothetical protein